MSESVIPPSSLFVLWPGEHPPMAEEIRLRLAEWGQAAPEMGEEGPEETLWSFWFELSEKPSTCFVWCEPLGDSHRALLDNVHWRTDDQRRTAFECRWMVGIEGPLALREPAADYQLQLRLCEAISLDWSPAIFDASALLYRNIDDVRCLTETRTPPRKSCLYSIHKVRSSNGDTRPDQFWIHTHGLERVGVPEIELLDIPETLLGSACELIDAVADLWIEFNTPDAETFFSVGGGIEIAWRPWQAVVAEMRPDAAGGQIHRRADQGHAGFRAILVVANTDPKSTPWVPPLVALRRITRSETTLYKTVAESRRMARLAKERWSVFGLLFASHQHSGWRFAVKLCFPMEEDPRHGEHLWFDVQSIRPGRMLGRLISVPSHLSKDLIAPTGWHNLDRLSDWRIVTPYGLFDPETAAALLEERPELAPV